MTFIIKDRVFAYSNSTGASNFVLEATKLGYRNWSDIGDTNSTYYTIVADNGDWEVGQGIYLAANNELQRVKVYSNSQGNQNKIVFDTGLKEVFCGLPAEEFNRTLKKDLNLSDLTDFAQARANLGFGSAALADVEQSIGNSIDNVMSQKAITDAITNGVINGLNTLGTSAYKDVTETNLDTTLDRVLRVSDFGLGSQGLWLPGSGDFDKTVTPTGFYKYSKDATPNLTKNFPESYGSILSFPYSNIDNRQIRLFAGVVGKKGFYFQNTSNSSEWEKIILQRNFSEQCIAIPKPIYDNNDRVIGEYITVSNARADSLRVDITGNGFAEDFAVTNELLHDEAVIKRVRKKPNHPLILVNAHASYTSNGKVYLIGPCVIDGVLVHDYVSGVSTDREIAAWTSDCKLIEWNPGNGQDLNEYIEQEKILWTVGHQTFLIKNGSVDILARVDNAQISARTILAQRINGEVLLITLGGITDTEGFSYNDAAQIVSSLGNVKIAYAMDGGGSTQCMYDGYYLHTSSDVSPRPVRSVLTVQPDLPLTDIYYEHHLDISSGDTKNRSSTSTKIVRNGNNLQLNVAVEKSDDSDFKNTDGLLYIIDRSTSVMERSLIQEFVNSGINRMFALGSITSFYGISAISSDISNRNVSISVRALAGNSSYIYESAGCIQKKYY